MTVRSQKIKTKQYILLRGKPPNFLQLIFYMFGPIWAIIKGVSVVHLEVYNISVNNYVRWGGKRKIFHLWQQLWGTVLWHRYDAWFSKIFKLITDFYPIPSRVTLKSIGNAGCTVIQYNPFYPMFTEQWKGERKRLPYNENVPILVRTIISCFCANTHTLPEAKSILKPTL